MPESHESQFRCGDPECHVCRLPSEEQIQWTFTTSNTSEQFHEFSRINFSDLNLNPIVGHDANSGAEIDNFNSEGEEVPENPNVVRRTTPIPSEIPTGVHFSEHRLAIAPGGLIGEGGAIQVNFWEMDAESVRSAFGMIREWMVENEWSVGRYSSDYFSDGESDREASIPYNIILEERETGRQFSSISPTEVIGQDNCACGEEIEFPSIVCPSCRNSLYCVSCRQFSSDVIVDENTGIEFCSNCGSICHNEECEVTVFHSNYDRCPDCNPYVTCRGCSSRMYQNDPDIVIHEWEINDNTFMYCDYCFNGMCHSCGVVFDPGDIIVHEGHQCVACISRNNNEEWDEHSELENGQLTIPTIPGRETIRLVGVEIEGANGDHLREFQGGNELALELYHAGLSRNSEMGGYHSSSGRSLVHVERDSSVDWEMVIGPLNVARSADVDILNKSVKVVRKLINEKTLKLDMRAGLHIHVGADRVPFHNAYNLHKLYMYMEDFLYRFGAAKWPYHRSINRRGRDQAGKSPSTEGKLNFARTFSGQRYYGLSFDNYFARYFEQCGCGARTYGLFDECTCDLGKCTFEFRLFNTTANTIKLHAYLAMCQALVAKAIEMDEIKDLANYPALDFIKERLSDMHNSKRRKMTREWEKRIVFVNEQLPLTQEEKNSIHYCIMNSEMGKTVTNADILLETEEN